MACAACAASARGRTARRAAQAPRRTPTAVVMAAAPSSDTRTLPSVSGQLVEGHDLEVAGADVGERDADGQHRLTVRVQHLRRDLLVDDPLAAAPAGGCPALNLGLVLAHSPR